MISRYHTITDNKEVTEYRNRTINIYLEMTNKLINSDDYRTVDKPLKLALEYLYSEYMNADELAINIEYITNDKNELVTLFDTLSNEINCLFDPENECRAFKEYDQHTRRIMLLGLVKFWILDTLLSLDEGAFVFKCCLPHLTSTFNLYRCLDDLLAGIAYDTVYDRFESNDTYEQLFGAITNNILIEINIGYGLLTQYIKYMSDEFMITLTGKWYKPASVDFCQLIFMAYISYMKNCDTFNIKVFGRVCNVDMVTYYNDKLLVLGVDTSLTKCKTTTSVVRIESLVMKRDYDAIEEYCKKCSIINLLCVSGNIYLDRYAHIIFGINCGTHPLPPSRSFRVSMSMDV